MSVPKVHRATLDSKACKDQLDLRERRATKETSVLRVHRGRQVLKAPRDRKVTPELRVRKALKVRPGRRGCKGQPVLKG